MPTLGPASSAKPSAACTAQCSFCLGCNSQIAHFQRVGHRQLFLAVDRGRKRLLRGGRFVDVKVEPDLRHAVVVGDLAGGRQAGLGRDRRADALELHVDLRRFVGHGRQRQPHRVAAANAVGVEQREQQRLVGVEPRQAELKARLRARRARRPGPAGA